MAASHSGGGVPLSAEAGAALGEGIELVFGRWTALQMAVENQWGGRDSRAKADQLGPHYYEDLVDMMYDTIPESFNADFEDGSIEEIAEQLLIMHEECLQSNYSTIEKLRNSHAQGNVVSQSRQWLVITMIAIARMMMMHQWWMMKQLRAMRWWWTSQNPPSLLPTQMGGLLCHRGMAMVRTRAQGKILRGHAAGCSRFWY